MTNLIGSNNQPVAGNGNGVQIGNRVRGVTPTGGENNTIEVGESIEPQQLNADSTGTGKRNAVPGGGGGGTQHPGSLSKQQKKSIPIRIFNRKIFVGTNALGVIYKTEPIRVEGYQRMDIAFTVHAISANTSITAAWENAAVPETKQAENWETGSLPDKSFAYSAGTAGETSVMVLKDFLPYLRLTITMNEVASSGVQNIFAEISMTGHLHEKKGDT